MLNFIVNIIILCRPVDQNVSPVVQHLSPSWLSPRWFVDWWPDYLLSQSHHVYMLPLSHGSIALSVCLSVCLSWWQCITLSPSVIPNQSLCNASHHYCSMSPTSYVIKYISCKNFLLNTVPIDTPADVCIGREMEWRERMVGTVGGKGG